MTELWTPPENEITSLIKQPNFFDMTYLFQKQLDELRDEDEKFILGRHALTLLESHIPKQAIVDIHAASARIGLQGEADAYVDVHDIGMHGYLNDISLSIPPAERYYADEESRRHYQLMLDLQVDAIYPILERDEVDRRESRGLIPIMAAMSIALSNERLSE